jgi:outer membrane receptor protein involved in Fe transport
MTRRITTALLGTISLLALTAPVFADSGSIEEVVVTASKRNTALKDVPMAVTVVGQEDLDRLNARSYEDFINSVPGMSLSEASPTHPQLILRGINAGGVGSTVSTYLDETPYGSSSALANGVNTAPNLDTFDIERVEVLRGPQGTLYGSSTLGGLLKFVTNAPDPSGFAAQFEAGGTEVDHGGSGGFARAMVNLPLSDDLAVRLVGYDTHDGGWVDDPGRGVKNTNGVTNYGGRVEVLYKPTDKFSVRLNLLSQKIDAGNNNVEDVVVTGNTFHPLVGNYQELRTTNEPSRARYMIYNATINWDFDWANLTSATSYGTLRDQVFQDGTGILGVDIDGRLGVQKFTQEVRLASDSNGSPFEWLVGGYYTQEKAGLLQNLVLAPSTPPLGFLLLNSHYTETAAFADATYHFTPDFDVSLGGRYSENRQRANETGLGLAQGASSGDVFTWSAAAHYKLSDLVSVYGRIAKGYRPGGPNALPIGNPAGVPTSYGADSLINYEAGVKGDFFDNTVSFDADVFYIDWSNIQLLTVINNTGVNGNGGSARSEGVEWNVDWHGIENLSIGWNGAYTDAKLTEDTDPIVGGKSGDALPWAPKWTSTINADYRFDSGSAWTPYVGGSWRYIGERNSDFQAGGRPLRLDSYNELDLRVGLDWNQWELELYGKNLNNAKGVTAFAASGASAASGNAATVALIAPRLYGVVLRAKF